MRIDRQLRHLFCGLAALFCLAAVPAAHAAEREPMEQLRSTTLNLIRMLVQENVITREKAEVLIKQAEAEQAEFEQAKAEQAKAEQAKAEQAKAEQAKAEQAKAEQAKAEQAKAEQAKAEQAKVEQAKAEQAKAEQAKAEQAKVEQAKVEQAKAEQVKTEQVKVDAAKIDAPGDPNVVRVQYVPKLVKDQIREEIKNEVMAKAQAEGWVAPGSLPGWVSRIEWAGDLRLRYEKDRYPAGNETPINLSMQGIDNVSNTSSDRDRWRLRARLGAKMNISDSVSGGIRLTTGSVGDPVSANQTLGDSYTGSSKFSFALDRAYIKYDPASWLSLSGGRIENPWMNTDLVWDPDFAFDGVAAAMRHRLSDSMSGFATVGAFPIQEVQTTKDLPAVAAKDKWLYGVQAGFEWMYNNRSSLRMGLAYYDFSNVQGISNPTNASHIYDKTARQFHQKGNTAFDINNPQVFGSELWALASQFREVNLTGMLDIASMGPEHVVLTGDYVKNIGFKRSEVQANVDSSISTSPVGGNTGWMTKLLVGMPETTHRNDWNVFGAYKRLETNAVLDAYTDSDFHLGGTNAKGWIAGGNYGIDKNTWLSLRWFSADEIVGAPLAIDVLMLDLSAKF